MKITSTQNPRLKSLVQLRDRKGRRNQQRFLVEGARELSRAVASGYQPLELFICPLLLSADARRVLDQVTNTSGMSLYELEDAAFKKIAVRETTDGIIAVFCYRHQSLQSLRLSENPLLLVAENIEKPGNLGAMIRSADGVGADAVIVLGHRADPFSPNVIRASLGTVFSVQVVQSTFEEFCSFIAQQRISCFAAALTPSARNYVLADMSGPTAIIMGAEATGITDELLAIEGKHIQIPMAGIADSLNVSVAAAVILYEAKRQRINHFGS